MTARRVTLNPTRGPAMPDGWTRADWTVVMMRIARDLCARCGHPKGAPTHTQRREYHDGLLAEVIVKCVACKCEWGFHFLGGGRVVYDDEPKNPVLNRDMEIPATGAVRMG